MTESNLQILESVKLALPASFLLLAGCAVFGLGIGIRVANKSNAVMYRRLWGGITLFALGIALFLMLNQGSVKEPVVSELFVFDAIAADTEKLTLLGALLLVLIGWSSAPLKSLSEYYGCLLILFSGLMFLGSANDLTTLFLSLELVSIPTYVLLGIVGKDAISREATLKYFALSSFSSTFFVLGLGYLYGMAGSTDLTPVRESLRQGEGLLPAVAWLLILGGLSFRLTAVPFHFYAPDVFQGTSTPLAALLAFLPKVAGFMTLVRLLGPGEIPAPMSSVVVTSLVVLGLVTMTVGNALALWQNNVRRLLAYSSVAHTGYMLVGLAALLSVGRSADPVVFYLAAYAAMTLGAFAVLQGIESDSYRIQKLSDLAGLMRRHPWYGTVLALCLLSLIGLPLTAGFWAKLQLILVSVATHQPLLQLAAVVMAINAAVAAGYYLPLLTSLYVSTDRSDPSIEPRTSASWATAICAALTVIWFFAPSLG